MRAARRSGKWLWRYDAKAKARCFLNVAVRRGKIVKQPCEVCGESKTQGHHEDYSKPLEVVWLCKRHHREKHTPPRPIIGPPYEFHLQY